MLFEAELLLSNPDDIKRSISDNSSGKRTLGSEKIELFSMSITILFLHAIMLPNVRPLLTQACWICFHHVPINSKTEEILFFWEFSSSLDQT